MFENINMIHILEEAQRKKGIIVDVRDEISYIKYHLPEAINVPLYKIKNGSFSLPRDRWLFLYCDYGGSSAMAAKILSKKGYHVVNAVGGLVQYNKALTLNR